MVSAAPTRTSSASIPSRQTITSLIIGFSPPVALRGRAVTPRFQDAQAGRPLIDGASIRLASWPPVR